MRPHLDARAPLAPAALLAVGVLYLCVSSPQAFAAEPATWARHTIDASSRGADGIRTSDVNADGLLDLTTGWEEGGVVRVYLNPGPHRAKSAWPAVSVGQVPAPEDAVFAHLDGDGAIDVVSSTEGDSRTLFVHWAPAEKQRYQDAAAWTTGAIEATQNQQQWMFALPLDVDGRNGIDLVVGGKNAGAQIGWIESPADPRDLSAWRWHPLYEAGWIMSLVARDMDADGDLDILASDRKGPRRGVLWLENPGPVAVAIGASPRAGAKPVDRSGPRSASPGESRTTSARLSWIEHRIGEVNRHEVMFLDAVDVDGDGLEDVVAAVREGPLLLHKRLSASPARWETHEIPLPETAGTGKAVAAADIDLDGVVDLVFSCENAAGGKSGVGWLSRSGPIDGNWEFHEISGPEGTKFDRLELLDLDGDGDLDVVTCEETENLGVIWYENPAR